MPTSPWPKTPPTRDRITKLQPYPPHFAEPEKLLFRQIVSEFVIADAGSEQLLITACEAHARARLCREAVDRDGMMVVDRFGVKQPHPLLKAEASARGQYLASLRALNLEPPKPGMSKRNAW
jgi:Phage terminase, small subunit